MDLFELIEYEDVRKNDIPYINRCTATVVPITDTKINELYVTAYVIDSESPEAVVIYRYRDGSSSLVVAENQYTTVHEIMNDITGTDNMLLKLHLLEVLFYTWGFNESQGIEFVEFTFEPNTISFALYSQLISIRFLSNLFALDPIVFQSGIRKIDLDSLYNTAIECSSSGSLLSEFLSFMLYCRNPQPWITICSNDENRSIQQISVVKDAYTVSDISECPKHELPSVPLYKFSMFDLKAKTPSILEYASKLQENVIVTFLTPLTVSIEDIPDNVTFVNSSSDSQSLYPYQISSEQPLSTTDDTLSFFEDLDSSASHDCTLNGDSCTFNYPSNLLSVLDRKDPSINYKRLEEFTEYVFE